MKKTLLILITIAFVNGINAQGNSSVAVANPNVEGLYATPSICAKIIRLELSKLNKYSVYDAFDMEEVYAQDSSYRLNCLSKSCLVAFVYKIKADIIAGAANNQLADEVKHGKMLKEKGIAYAPDFLINAGGIINVYGELKGYSKEQSIKKTENIYNTTLEIFKNSDKENITTHQAAFNLAQNRIDKCKK